MLVILEADIEFIKDLLMNLLILVVIGIALFFLFPDIMREVFNLYGQLLGPLVIIILVVIALPTKRRPRS